MQLTQGLLLVLDELSGTDKHLLELRYILGPEWRVFSDEKSGRKGQVRYRGTAPAFPGV